jgi:hypothetical protein
MPWVFGSQWGPFIIHLIILIWAFVVIWIAFVLRDGENINNFDLYYFSIKILLSKIIYMGFAKKKNHIYGLNPQT